MIDAAVDALIAHAKKTPYFHLYHGDGSLYMERHWLLCRGLQSFVRVDGLQPVGSMTTEQWFDRPDGAKALWAARLHHIATPDHDRELHDHPWDFYSLVLRGGYIERRPKYPTENWFNWEHNEIGIETWRLPGSLAFRRHTDRHRITHVLPDTWTLVITSPKRHEWGFYTEKNGKVHWKDYESVHRSVA